MSKVAITGNASGTGTFTIASPNSNSDRTLTLPDNSGTVLTTAGGTLTGALALPSGGLNVGSGQLAVDASGRVTMSAQPAFFVGGSNGTTAASVTYVPNSGFISYNVGGALNTTTGVFTAPVTGMYMFSWIFLMQGVTNAAQVDPQYVVNGVGFFYGPRAVASSPNTFGDGYFCVTGSVVRKLSAGDTFYVSSVVSTGTFKFYDASTWTQYMGMLIG